MKVFNYISGNAGNLNLYDLAQLDDLWFEAMLNEKETIENGIVCLIDMSGYEKISYIFEFKTLLAYFKFEF